MTESGSHPPSADRVKELEETVWSVVPMVRPALVYGAETWALKKAQEKKMEVALMRML